MTIRIGSFLTRSGLPADDIPTVTPGFPTVRVWELDPITDLVVGSPNGSGSNVDGVMTLLSDGTQHDGFYYYDFTEALSYNENFSYLIRVDGGTSLTAQERYHVISVSANAATLVATDIARIGDEVLDELLTDHTVPGSLGEAVATIGTATDQLVLGVVDLLDVVDTIKKYSTARTRIDTDLKQLIVYDEDCVTILRTFQLLDANGVPSIESITERKPIYATDGPVCS